MFLIIIDIDTSDTPCESPKFDGDFLEGHPKILRTRDLTNDIIQESTCNKCLQTTFIGNPKVCTDDNTLIRENVPDVPLNILENIQQVADCPNNIQLNEIVKNQERQSVTPVAEVNEYVKECIAPPKIVEIKEKLTKPLIPTVATVDVLSSVPSKNCHPPSNEIWLNKSLVPYEYTCKNGEHQKKLLVSYPVTDDPNEPRPRLQETIEPSSTCRCIAEKGYCGCTHCNRNPNVPFGKRFPADIDSLHRVAVEKVAPYTNINNIISSGYNSLVTSEGSSGYFQIGNETPKVFSNGFSMSSGSGRYSDPSKEVIFKEPSIMEQLRSSNHLEPYLTHTKFVSPPLYKVIPKYNIVPKKIPSLDIPDLVPANQYVCACPRTRSTEFQIIQKPIFCPLHGHIPYPSENIARAPVIDIPNEISPLIGHTRNFLGHVNAQRGIP